MADFYNRGGGSQVLTDLEVDGTTVVVDETNDRVGIGTAEPGVQLEVQDTTTSSANTGGALRLSANDGAAMGDSHRLGVIEFTGAEDTSNTQVVGARIEAMTDAAWTNAENGAALYFYTTDGNASQTNVLKIDSNQKATFSGQILASAGDCVFGNGQDAAISVSETSSGTDGRDLTVSAGSAPTGSANQNGGDLLLKAGGGDGTGTSVMTFSTKVNGTDAAAERMRLHTNGYLGVGTAAPSQIIHAAAAAPIVVVQNTTNEHSDGGAESKVIFGDHAGNALAMIEGAHSGSSDDSKGQFKISTDNGSGTQLAMSIDDAQVTTFAANVVVGGTTPKITIGDAGTEDTMLAFDGNAVDFRVGIDDGTDTLEIGVGTAHGTTPTLTLDSSQNIDVFRAVNLDSAIPDNSICGITAVFTAGESLNRGDVVYFKAADSKMYKVNMTAGNADAIPAVAMAGADISADALGKFVLQGFVHDAGTFPSYTIAGRLYAPEAEGPPTQTAPSTDGDLVQVVGWAVTADKIYFSPSPDYIEVA
mgnify:CR=1 FL=1